MNRTAFLLSVCAAVNFTACTTKPEEKTDAGKFTITSPIYMDTSVTKEYVAQIQSVQNIEIRAMIKGFIETVRVDEGQHVNAGQVLFNIRPIEFQSELLKAKAEAKQAELELQNVKALSDKNIVSKTELSLASAKLDAANAEVSLAELNLSYTEIKAPFEGVIDRIKFKVGSLINEGNLLTSLSNNKEVYAYFNVSENEYLDFRIRAKNNGKDSARLMLANNEPHKYKGAIQTVEGEFDNNTGNIAYRAKFPNPDLLLKNGETGKIQLRVALRNVLVIPQKATFEVQDKIYVYVIDQNNVAKTRLVTIKQKLPNIYVIDTGLSAGDKILLDGSQSVKEDDKIQTEFIPAQQAIQQLQLIKQ
jgi:membrane fusion protein, multidrug efflux system